MKGRSFPFSLSPLGDTQPQRFVVYQRLQNPERGICLILSLSRFMGTKSNWLFLSFYKTCYKIAYGIIASIKTHVDISFF